PPLATAPNHLRDSTYDLNGNLASSIDGMGGSSRLTTTYSYNGAGWLTQTVDPRGVTANYSYDNLGRRTARWATGTVTNEDGSQQTFTQSGTTESYTSDDSANMLSATG